MSTQAMERQEDRSPDVARAAQRLGRPRARISLALKRLLDIVLALVMLVALLPVLIVVVLLLAFAGDGWFEKRMRLGRNGRSVVLTRFRELPGGAFGRGAGADRRARAAAAAGRPARARELRRPARAPARDRRGLHRPAPADGARPDRAGAARRRRPRRATRSTTPTSRNWTLWRDAQLLVRPRAQGRSPQGVEEQLVDHGLDGQQRDQELRAAHERRRARGSPAAPGRARSARSRPS